MGLNIESGDQHSYNAIVNSDGQLAVVAETVRQLSAAAERGDAFYAVTGGFIALTTTASFSGILYLKNTSTTKNLKIAQLRTCGNVAQQWLMYKKPTTGTLISGGTAIVPENVNFQSGSVFSGDALYGADGDTITDGSILAQWQNGAGHSTHDFDGAIILGTNDTIALTCKPGAAGDVCVACLCYFEDA